MNKLPSLDVLVNRLAHEFDRDDGKPVTLVVGSGVSLPSVAGTGDVVDLALEALGLSDRVPKVDIAEVRNEPSLPKRYGNALFALGSFLGPDAVHRVVQAAVLRAYQPTLPGLRSLLHERGDRSLTPEEANELEKDLRGWSIPPGLESLAGLISEYPDRFCRPIITPNFDPLIRVAVRRTGRAVHTSALSHDGRYVPDAGGETLDLVHVHGYWHRDGHTLHSAAELTRPRPQLTATLVAALRGSLVVVVGYGGWNDVFVEALQQALNQDPTINLLWALHGKRKDLPEETAHRIEQLEEFAGSFQLYERIDANVLFPELARKLARDPVVRLANRPSSGDVATVGALVEQFDRLQAETDFAWSPPGNTEAAPDVLWPVRLREPNLVHAAQATIARLIMGAGGRVLLLIDDLNREDQPLAMRLIHRLGMWIGADDSPKSQLLVQRLSTSHTGNPRSALQDPTFGGSLELLRSATQANITLQTALSNAKLTPPGAYVAPRPLTTDDLRRLLSPLILRDYIAGMTSRGVELDRICTLGGSDEQTMWQSFDGSLRGACGHLYVPSLREPSDEPNSIMDHPWSRALDEGSLRAALRGAAERDGWDQRGRMIPWVCETLVRMPAIANGGDGSLAVGRGRAADIEELAAALRGVAPETAFSALAGAAAASLAGPVPGPNAVAAV